MEKYTKNQFNEDSNTLDNFFSTLKRQKKEEKRNRKDQSVRERKQSCQLSIFGWLVKDRPTQSSLITKIDKPLILQIFKFMRLTEIMMLSRTCYYMYQCSQSLWNDRYFFSQFETEKFTHKQLKKVIQKSSRLTHIKQLKHIYSGKNLGSCRQRIKLRVSESTPTPGTLLEIFEVAPKNHRVSSFINDAHLQEIVNSSFRSLKVVNLIHCSYLKSFQGLSRCIQLTKLSIVSNDYFNCKHLAAICKRCTLLQQLSIIDCRSIEQDLFKSISLLQNLKKLTLRGYKQPFTQGISLSNNRNLTELDLQNCLIVDTQLIQICKNCPNINFLNIQGCSFLTDTFLSFISKQQDLSLKHILIYRTEFSQNGVEKVKLLNPSVFLDDDANLSKIL